MVGLNDTPGYRQTEPCAFLLSPSVLARLHKLVEDRLLLAGIHAWTRVAHGNIHIPGICPVANRQRDATALGRELQRIAYEVNQYLLDAFSIHGRARKPYRQFGQQADLLLLGLRAHEGYDAV